MLIDFNGKSIRIDDDYIQKNMKVLHISKDEAIQQWLEDEGYLENEYQQELLQKSKENPIKLAGRANVTNKTSKRVKKIDPDKNYLIQVLTKALEADNINTVIKTEGKLITFSYNDNDYKLDLIKTRKKEGK